MFVVVCLLSSCVVVTGVVVDGCLAFMPRLRLYFCLFCFPAVGDCISFDALPVFASSYRRCFVSPLPLFFVQSLLPRRTAAENVRNVNEILDCGTAAVGCGRSQKGRMGGSTAECPSPAAAASLKCIWLSSQREDLLSPHCKTMFTSQPSSSASSVANFSPPNYKHVWNLLLSLPVLMVLKVVAKSTPYARQGFFCNDNEIRYPYNPDTIPPNLMDVVFIVVGLASVIGTECSLVRHLTRSRLKRLHRPEGLAHPLVVNCLYFLSALLASNFAANTICDIGKRTCSRLRPNFLAVCQPKNLSTLCPPNEFGYISDYECTNKLFDQNEYFAFPSGHSALVCDFAVFVVYYLQKRCKVVPSLRAFAQFFVVLFAYFVCLTRVRDHKHRLTDVGGGALIGTAVGVFFVSYVLHNFRPNRYSLVDRQNDWADIESSMAPVVISGEKFSVRQTVMAGKDSDIDQREEKATTSNSVVSDYGSFNAQSPMKNFCADEAAIVRRANSLGDAPIQR